MSNNIIVNKGIGIITDAVTMSLVDNLKFLNKTDSAKDSDWEGKANVKAGSTIYRRKPARFIPTNNMDITSADKDIVEEYFPISASRTYTVPVALTVAELSTDLPSKALVKRVVDEAVPAIAQYMENYYLTQALNASYQQAGTPGASTYSVDEVAGCKTLLDESLAPMDNKRFLLLNSRASGKALGARAGLFQSSSQIAQQYEDGEMGKGNGFTWLQNELLPSHTNGTANQYTISVTTTASEGASTIALTSSGGSTENFTVGTRFTVAGVYKVHPITKQVLPDLQQFVITETVAAVAGAFAAVKISPTLYTATSKTLQNISALPQGSAAVTVISGTASATYGQGLAFHRDAFVFGSVPLELPTPGSVDFAARSTYKGVSLSIVRAYDVVKAQKITRIDVLPYFGVQRPEWAACYIA